jgi:hypothetical protein
LGRCFSIVFCIGTVLASQSGQSARADWQYTRWGMNKAEVVTASSGRAREHHVAQRESWGVYPDLVAPSRFAAHEYRAYFYFNNDNGGLEAVRLVPKLGVWCPDIARALMTLYGSDQRLIDGYFIWRDPAANNTVSLSQFSTCRIKYEPLRQAANQ